MITIRELIEAVKYAAVLWTLLLGFSVLGWALLRYEVV